MPRSNLCLQYDDGEYAAFAEIFGGLELDNDNKNLYADYVDGDGGMSFSMAAAYSQTNPVPDLHAAVQASAMVESIPTKFKGTTARRNWKKKNRNNPLPSADDILATGGYLDKKAVYDAMEALHPELLLLLDTHFVPPPGVSIYDDRNYVNQSRKAFLQANANANRKKAEKLKPTLIEQDGHYAFLSEMGEQLVAGDALCVFQYVVELYPQLSHYIYTSLIKHPHNVKLLGGRANYVHLLKMYRYERSLAKSLDKMSKISQLGRSDSDAPYFWFDDLIVDDLILHPRLPLQVKARYQHCEVQDLDDFISHNSGATYVADLTKGTAFGASGNDWKQLEKLLASQLPCYLHLYLEDRLVGLPMVMVSKPRPHNHTAVFYLDPDMDPYTLLDFELTLDEVRLANEERNTRLYTIYKATKICPMPPHNMILDMLTYVRDLWRAADDVRVTKNRQQIQSTPYAEDVYTELAEVFSAEEMPSFSRMRPTKGLFTMVTKPLRAFVMTGIAKAIQYNLIRTATEGKIAFFFGEWWYVANQYTAPTVPYHTPGAPEKVYKSTTFPISIPKRTCKQ